MSISPLEGKLWLNGCLEIEPRESVITLADCYHNCGGREGRGGSFQLKSSRNRGEKRWSVLCV
jgi:hypothetical protein